MTVMEESDQNATDEKFVEEYNRPSNKVVIFLCRLVSSHNLCISSKHQAGLMFSKQSRRRRKLINWVTIALAVGLRPRKSSIRGRTALVGHVTQYSCMICQISRAGAVISVRTLALLGKERPNLDTFARWV
jgi:hypothetical protein